MNTYSYKDQLHDVLGQYVIFDTYGDEDACLKALEEIQPADPRIGRVEALIEEWQDACDEWAAFHPEELQSAPLRSLLDDLRAALGVVSA